MKGVGGLYTVYQEGAFYTCPARGIFRKQDRKPMIGDSVLLSEVRAKECTGVIQELLPRRNSLVRPAVANVDQIVLVAAAVSPSPDLPLIDRLLVAARKRDIDVVIVINKLDQDRTAAERLLRAYKPAVSHCLMTCTKEGEGLSDVLSVLQGRISVLAGQSGAGKSSLLNLLLKDAVMETGGLSRKTERGRHTTRHAEMFWLPDLEEPTFVIDSPGFSMFDLADVSSGELAQWYPEMADRETPCRFLDCSHTGEPDCTVRCLVDDGLLDEDRYERYKMIYQELREKEKNKYR